jgi:hypothetical protein
VIEAPLNSLQGNRFRQNKRLRARSTAAFGVGTFC